MKSPLRSTALLALAVLLAPLAAAGLPLCSPAGHCPMAPAASQSVPCHGSVIQADDCCPADTAAAVVDLASVSPVAAPASADMALTSRPAPGTPLRSDAGPAPATPLYTLFRSLLI